MAITMRLKIGGSEIAVAGKNLKELIREASVFSELPCECGLCKSKNIGFKYRMTKDEDEYYEMLCRDCLATYALGQHKNGDTLFPKGNKDTGGWDEKYERRKDDDRGRDDRKNDRQDDRRDSRREEPRGRQQDERRREPERKGGRGADHPDEEDNIPFADHTRRDP